MKLQGEIRRLFEEIAQLSADIEALDEEVKIIKSGLEQLKANVKERLDALRDWFTWGIGIAFALILLIIGSMVALTYSILEKWLTR